MPEGRQTTVHYTPFPRAALAQSIPARFEQQVASGPERLAVKRGPDALTYEALNRYANRVAHSILAAVGPASEPVALLIEQGPSQVAAILGALKAGKVYVPERRFLLHGAGASARPGPAVLCVASLRTAPGADPGLL